MPFTKANALQNACKAHQTRAKANGLKQAFELQNLCFDAALTLRASVPVNGKSITRENAMALAQLVRAWEACQERIRIHRGKPMPGSLKPGSADREKAQQKTLGSFGLINGSNLSGYCQESTQAKPDPIESESAGES